MRRIVYALGTLASLLLPIAAAAGARPDATVADGRLDAADRQRIETLEQAVRADPENLHVAAEYRQFMIACGEFDRATRLFETLTKGSTGPNAHISLALSYVDKVPVSGDLRRLYLARDAMRALTRAIEQHPTPLAYYIRGQINLFFNNKIFHRAHLGVEDLQKALALVTDETPPALVQRVWVTLGDGHWRADNPVKARETWADAATRFPANADLQVRLTADQREVAFAVRHALDDNIRVDTSLRGLVATP